MTKPDLAETVNRGHDALIEELKALDASDRSFPYWLSSAALHFCVAFTDVKLEGKLKHVDDLEEEVKTGFQQMKLSALSKIERAHAKYCLARFTRISEEKAKKREYDGDRTQPCHDLRSKRSITKKYDDSKLEIKAKATTNLKTRNEKTPRDLEVLQNIPRASIPLRVKRNSASRTTAQKRSRIVNPKVNVLAASIIPTVKEKEAPRESDQKSRRRVY